MNFGEGMRRLGIVLGVVGGAIGMLSGYESARTVWNAHITHQRFESLMASPLMLRVAKDAKEFKAENWNEADQVAIMNALAADPDFLKLSPDAQKRVFLRVKGCTAPSEEGDVMDVLVNLGGVKEVMVDKSRLISSIELSTGESIPRTEPPTLIAFMALLLYPLGGFLAPWGAIRVLAWLVAGFFSK
jgi:hypothetical protein